MAFSGTIPILCILTVQLVVGSYSQSAEPVVGRLFIRFVRYDNDRGIGFNGHCCDGKFGICEPNGCDHTFRVCVDKASGLSGSVYSCHYVTKHSSEIANQDHVVFGDAFGNVRNPIVVDFKKIPDSGNVSLKVDVWDEDGKFSDPDYVDTLRSLIPVSPQPKNSEERSQEQIKYRTRLTVQWYTVCTEHLYGTRCNVRCEPNGRYSCDATTGRKICKKGWSGENCENIAWCDNEPCLNNGTCRVKDGGYTCTCPRGWSGINCEVRGSPCDLNPCLPGGCINHATSYVCVCPPGYTVSRDSEIQESCAKAPTTIPPPTTTPKECVCPTLPPTTTTTTTKRPTTTTTTTTTERPTTTTTAKQTTTTPEEIDFVNRPNADCDRLAQTGNRYRDGVYTIRVSRFPPFPVYCDMSDKGYTVIQERVSSNLNFARSWQDYKDGFGNVGFNTNYFLGLEKIYWLTNQRRYKLVITMQLANRSFKFATYEEFWIESEANNYRLHVSGYSGTAGDALIPHNGASFSTFDRDNDGSDNYSCGSGTESGWWFYSGTYRGRRCFLANLNGFYVRARSGWPYCATQQCIQWYTIRNYEDYSLVKTQMKILPNPRSRV